MKIILRSQTNTDEEIQLGQKLGFTTIKGIQVISATANLNGLSPLSAIVRYLNFDIKTIRKHVDYSNINGLVKHIDVWPNLILVPPTRGDTGRHTGIESYIINILKICNNKRFEKIHFTHYGFINGNFPENEIYKILSILLNQLIFSKIDVFYWEIDSRFLRQMKEIYCLVDENCNGMHTTFPEVIFAPKTNYEDYISNKVKNYWQEFYGRNF
jgi:hypothetical protein